MSKVAESFFSHNIWLSVLLFSIGILGVFWQRNALAVLMCFELMLNAANLAIINFAQMFGDQGGAILVLFVIAVAAAEAAVGLAIFIRLYRLRSTILLDKADQLRG